MRATAALNVRSGAGTNYMKITTVSNGTNMVYLGETATVGGTVWYKVTTSAGIGWVSGLYSRLVTTPDVKPVTGASGSSSSGSSYTKVYVSGGSVWLRSGPSLNYSRVAVVYEGTNLNYRGSSSVDGRGVRWYNVHLQRAERVDLLALRQTVLTVNFTNIPCVRGPRRV